MGQPSPLMTVIEAAARKAARSVLRDFNEVEHLQVSRKGTADFVTAADKKCEDTLRHELLKARPTFGWLGEETGEVKGDGEHRFIVDPIDGTHNFMHGIPHFAMSIGVEQNGEIIAALVYQPLLDERYWAEKGKGAFLNQRRLKVSVRDKIEDCILALGHVEDEPAYLDRVFPLYVRRGMRSMGSGTLDMAYVAAGRFDGMWIRKFHPWDVAAGQLLVKEAGGMISELNGSPITPVSFSVIAANKAVYPQLLEMVKANSKTD